MYQLATQPLSYSVGFGIMFIIFCLALIVFLNRDRKQ